MPIVATTTMQAAATAMASRRHRPIPVTSTKSQWLGVSGRRRPFTLIELLVVTVIIAMLISLLLPALNEARGRGKLAVCMSNLRQLSVGVLSYTNDFEHKVPPHYNTNTGSGTNNGYYMKTPTPRWMPIGRFGGYRDPGAKLGAGFAYPDYMPGPGIFYCPANELVLRQRNHSAASGYDADAYFTLNPKTRINRHTGLAYYGQSGYFWSSYAFPGIVDPLAEQRFSLGHTSNGNYWNWYRTYGGYYLPNMDHARMSLLYQDVVHNAEDGKPMAFDTSFGPGALGDGSQVTLTNHDLRFASVVYWDGHGAVYPYAEHLYYNRRYGYGYNGFTDRTAVNILMRFGNGETTAR